MTPKRKTVLRRDSRAHGSGTRAKASPSALDDEPRAYTPPPIPIDFDALPPLDPRPAPREDPKLEEALFKLLTAVEQNAGMTYPASWAPIVHEAKRRGWVEERGAALNLHLRKHGQQVLATRAAPASPVNGKGTYSMTKASPRAILMLKDLAHDTGVPMQEAIGYILQAIHEHRDELTRAARAAGYDHPWDAVGVLLRRRA